MYRRPFIAALALLSLSLATTAEAASSPEIVNGGFDHDATGWTFMNVDAFGGWYTGSVFGGPGNPGGFVVLNSNGVCQSDPTISQVVTGLTIGNSYQIRFDYANRHPGYGSPSALSFGVFLDNNEQIYSASNPGVGWTEGMTSFVATAESHTIDFRGEMNCDDTSYGLDNVAIFDITPSQPTPELGTVVLVGAGAVVLVGAVALRRR